MQKQARITSKGQITVPKDIRLALSVRPGDKLIFENDGASIRVLPVRVKSVFAKYRGIGNSGIPSGRKGIRRWVRELRGE